MKTVVLDDDPTGTQSASHVRVLLDFSADLIEEALRSADSVYVQTNSRAIDEAAAVQLVTRVRTAALEAAERLGEEVQFVLRGDSTLRGHVFSETTVFATDESIVVFVPAFPAGGRTTTGGVHYVRVGADLVPAHETEFAADPVFPFSTAVLVDYVAEKSGRVAVSVPLSLVRTGALAPELISAAPGTVVLPDAETDDDIRAIARAISEARSAGRDIAVRCASPLAAALAGVESTGLLAVPLVDSRPRVLLACGSHTKGATAQLDSVVMLYGDPVVIPTARALIDPITTGEAAAEIASTAIAENALAVVTTERVRASSHNTLEHGEKVMTALTTAVRLLVPSVDVVVAKGGITSAEIARTGIGARSALVLGQVLPGISVWQLESFDGRSMLYVVVPGNVGGPDTLTQVLAALLHGRSTPAQA